MPGPRRSNLVRSRRRVEDEGEEDAGVASEHGGDSQSEASVPTDHDAEGDADDSDLSESDTRGQQPPKAVENVNGHASEDASKKPLPVESSVEPATSSEPSFAMPKDTDTMMNGLKIEDGAVRSEAVDFDALDKSTSSLPAQGLSETPAERRRREHEEYKKKRDTDPAFIPNRGAFFMHDHRSAGPGQNGVRPAGRGRGRGRGGIGGPFSPANLTPQTTEATNDPWKHDLHETLNEQAQPNQNPPPASTTRVIMPPAPSQQGSGAGQVPPNRTFSSTKQIGKIQIRLSLPSMKDPVLFSEVPVRQYTRLPNHRPPLRRDKPVRVSLPDYPVRYIFPSTDRSFIFIPRAQRPNQQSFGLRGRGRPFGSIGGISSRRTSAYGGSVYSPSVGMSRRSSLVGQYGREGLISPTGSVLSRPQGAYDGRPVVRLPPGSQQHTAHGTPVHSAVMSGAGTPVIGMPPPPPQSYPLPQKPAFRENWSGPLPMHQPRPQKNVSVSGIESPESLTYHAPQQQEQQPFHQQVPPHMEPRMSSPGQFQHSRQPSFAGQPVAGTPLSNIPERAIHAQPFQPFQPGFQQGMPAQPAYFYPPPAGGQGQFAGGMANNAVIAPMFVPNGQHGGYMAVPTVAAAGPGQGAAVPAPGSGSMVPYETNGMVYYIDPSQQQYQAPVEGFNAQSYTMPGMGGMMTPTPDGSYYYSQMPQGAVYYQPQ